MRHNRSGGSRVGVLLDPATPLGFLTLLLQDRRARLATSRDAGASAVEWVLISAILITIAGAVGFIIFKATETKANSLDFTTP
ncbi:MAG: hypothetical protein ACRC35_04335 [Angustibacter sp.]